MEEKRLSIVEYSRFGVQRKTSEEIDRLIHWPICQE